MVQGGLLDDASLLHDRVMFILNGIDILCMCLVTRQDWKRTMVC